MAEIEPTDADNDDAQPIGELQLRTLAMPRDTNPAGDIFGGWLLSQMDIAGAIICKQHARGRVVTIAIDAMEFHQPVYVGDVVCCYAHIERIGRSSMAVRVQAWCIRQVYDGTRIKVTEGMFTYVAIDEHGKPRPVDA
ncbi:MAG: acyl-CoA thioesterase [Phycisphaera sp.]|nr:acyl-CoA thioesterase [Phycisphaera sp.]